MLHYFLRFYLFDIFKSHILTQIFYHCSYKADITNISKCVYAYITSPVIQLYSHVIALLSFYNLTGCICDYMGYKMMLRLSVKLN